ncbi:MAG TPA: hypothetical protein DDZ88_14725 [Verrucomicrobiales bacterium]|nr:hypothetical protein [Verrucomicrobiales bacterium]
MTKFKLELFRRKPNDKLVLGAAHIAAMTDNTNYPAPTRVPTDAQMQTAQDDLAAAEAAVDAAEIAWKMKIQERDAKEAAWDTVITARANNCEAVTPNDLVALQSTGFPLRSSGAPIGALPAPGDLRATATEDEGVIELRCKTVNGASSYEWECRLHEGSPPWQAVKTSTSTKILAASLTPGSLYAFRVRAIGAAGPGTWSDEAVERAP